MQPPTKLRHRRVHEFPDRLLVMPSYPTTTCRRMNAGLCGPVGNAGVALAAGLLLARQVRRPTLATAGLAAMCLGSSLAWVALSPTGVVFLAAMPYFGFAVVWYGTSSQALIQQHAPAEMSGRMMSLYTLGSMGTTLLGALIVGAAIDRWSPRVAIGLGASSALLAGLALCLIAARARAYSPSESCLLDS